MKTCTFGIGAFGFAVLCYLGRIHPEQVFYAFEKDNVMRNYLKEKRIHPYFFPGQSLPKNVKIVDSPGVALELADTLILAMPNQFIRPWINEYKDLIGHEHAFINLSKGIDIVHMTTVSDSLKEVLGADIHYATLSGGMIAKEVIEGKILGADIGVSDMDWGSSVRSLFQSSALDIDILLDYKSIELLGALKNILALLTGYYEGKGYGASSIGRYLKVGYVEIQKLLGRLGGDQKFGFDHFSSGGDIIATCFGDSRNRYFGRLVGEGIGVHDALEKLQNEKKTAEGYTTLQAISEHLSDASDFPEFSSLKTIFGL